MRSLLGRRKSMENDKRIRVEVAYALPDRQIVIPLTVRGGATVKDAVLRSGIVNLFPEIDPDRNKVGVFGRVTSADRILKEGDRVEIYRPLMADPRELRQRRAKGGTRDGEKGR